MTALEKIRFLIAEEQKEYENQYRGPYLIDVTPSENKWSPGELDALKQDYPWLPPFYLNFIEEFDSLGLAFVRFFGSENNDVNPIKEEIDYWSQFLKSDEMPIGKYADGSIYTIHKDRKIRYYIKDDYECEEPKIIAEDIESFIDQCILGKRYPEFAFIEENTFYKFLVDQGWA